MAAGSAEYEQITQLKATMSRVPMLQADMLDQVAEIERLHLAEKVGCRDTQALLLRWRRQRSGFEVSWSRRAPRSSRACWIIWLSRSHPPMGVSDPRSAEERHGDAMAEVVDRLARRAEAHHIRPWIEGGATNLANLVLLCRRHHRMLHHPEWKIRVRDGIPNFIPPKWIDPLQRPMRNVIRQ